MNRPKLCCIGHITLDKIITPRHEADLFGGTAWYFANALAGLGDASFRLITSLAPGQMDAVDTLRGKGIDVEVIPSHHTVYFENRYGSDPDDRTQRVLAKADPFTPENLSGVEADTFHLGTLLADDFPPEAIKYLSTRGQVSVDAQGYLREVRGESVHAVDWADKLEALPYIDIIKANEKEMLTITGTDRPRDAARRLASWGAREVLLTLGERGSLIYADGEFTEVPAYPVIDLVDATGCGDTYMAGYLYARSRGASRYDSGRFAAAMCTLKLARSGPFSGTLDDIRALLS